MAHEVAVWNLNHELSCIKKAVSFSVSQKEEKHPQKKKLNCDLTNKFSLYWYDIFKK